MGIGGKPNEGCTRSTVGEGALMEKQHSESQDEAQPKRRRGHVAPAKPSSMRAVMAASETNARGDEASPVMARRVTCPSPCLFLQQIEGG